MRVLVLGGTRFIGAAAVRTLAADGHQVTCFHRGRTATDLPAEVRHLHGDHEQLAEHTAALAETRPDVLLDMRPLNAETAARTLRCAEAVGAARLVAISSCDVYRSFGRLLGREDGPVDNTPVPEDGPLRTRPFPYRGEEPRPEDDPMRFMDDYDKIPAERAFLGHTTIAGTVLRLPMVYGPGDYQHRFYPWIKRMVDGRPALVVARSMAEWRTCRGYVDDVGRAIAAAVTDPRAAGRIYNVAEPDAPTEAEWIRRVAEALGWGGRLVVADDAALPEVLLPGIPAEQHLRIDSARIRAELGYREQLPRAEAVARAVAWERDHPPEPAPELPYEAEDAFLAEEEE